MTLKQFEKVNAEVRTEYTVFDENGEYVETIKVNYIEDDVHKTGAAILRRDKYAGFTVRHVTVNTATKFLSVSLEPPKKRK